MLFTQIARANVRKNEFTSSGVVMTNIKVKYSVRDKLARGPIIINIRRAEHRCSQYTNAHISKEIYGGTKITMIISK